MQESIASQHEVVLRSRIEGKTPPDLAMLGYLAGPRTGAVAYDVVHTYVLPAVLAAAGVVADSDTALALALIWLTHIGVDRAVGYGLKYPSGFKDTHLQRV